MLYHIDKEVKQPAYLQLYTQVRHDIVHGVYPYGTKLPSKRLIVAECGISTITVEHAYALLCDEGYAEPRQRSGYFVIFRSGDGFARPREHLCVSLPTLPHRESEDTSMPFSVLAKTMRGIISTYEDGIFQRCEHQGCAQLRQAIAHYLARSRGIHVGADQIIIGSGSEYLYGMVVELLGAHRKYAIEHPSYKQIEQVYCAKSVVPEKLPLGTDGIDSTALQQCDADVLHISPYRSYPSGVTASASKRHEYLAWANASSRIIIEDDFESEFSVSKKPEDTLFSQSINQNVIYMNTFSKTVSSSLRVGYMVLPKDLMHTFHDKLGFYSCTVPTYIQFVLTELIENGDFERHINRIRRAKRKQIQGK